MRVKSVVTYGLLMGALALPLSAHALGLGKLTVESALGQPLSAKIELLPGSREELDSLVARVADPALYRQNNLQYQAVLSRARITVERGAGGETYLRVTSSALVNEPYLDLMVEVNWSSGRVVRDYTFLVDPPGAGTEVAQAEPVTPPRTGGAASRSQPAAVAAPTAGAPRAEGDSYTVKRGDTLSKIAKDYKPETVTLDQMLVALFKSNQGAFDGANMNRLRSGAIITIPNAVDTSAAQPAEATKIVRMQATDWRAYRDRVAGAAPMADESAGRAVGGKIGTAVEEKVPAAQPGADQLRLSKEGGAGKGSGAAENSAARDAALKEAQSRIADLEKTLKDMQRVADQKNQIAQLQTDASKGKAPAVVPPLAIPATPATKAADDAAAAKAAADAKSAADAKAAADAKSAADAKAAADAKTAADAKAAAAAPASTAPPPETKAPETKTTAPKAAPKAAAKAEPPGFFEDLMAGTPLWVMGLGALVILGALAFFVATRRRKTTKFEDSIISGTDIKTNTVFGSTGGGVVNTGDNSLASDFSREGLGNIDTDEVDPIAEAEVYLAYGRDAQAEEILKDALKKDPQRQEIYLKLLEIHAQHNKPSAFETVASELYSVCNGQGDTWHKAVALGRQLDPNNPMFAEGGAPGAAPDVHPLAMAADTADVANSPAEADRSLEYQMDEEISISPTSGAAPKSADDLHASAEEATAKSASAVAAASAALAGAMAAGKSAKEARAESVADKVEAARESFGDAAKFDLDFKLDDADKPAPMGKARAEPALATTAAEGPTSDMAPQLMRPAAALELDKLDLSFDPDRSTFEDPTPSVLDGQWHDAATKLDLAKAYQEMGDVEGAREILQEVLHEGDDQQKTEAKSLLAKLA